MARCFRRGPLVKCKVVCWKLRASGSLLAGCAKRGTDGEESRALVADGGSDAYAPIDTHLCLNRTNRWNDPGSLIAAMSQEVRS